MTEGSDAHDPLDLLTVDQVAALLKVKKHWIYDQVQGGQLPALKLGGHLRFRRVDLEGYLERLRR